MNSIKFITSRILDAAHHPFFFFFSFFSSQHDLHCISVESFTATKYANILPMCHHHPILPTPDTYLPLIYSTRTHGRIKKKKCFNGLSKESLLVLVLSWRSSTQFWHMDLLKHIKCVLWVGKMKHRHLFFGLDLRIPHLTVSPFQTHGGFADKVNKPSCALMQSPLFYFSHFHRLNYRHRHLARKSLKSSSSRSLPVLSPSCIHYIITVGIYFTICCFWPTDAPSVFLRLKKKSASLFVFQASQPRHRTDSHD